MTQEAAFRHEFVEFIPEELHERTLYVSIRFATVSHLCACGCGMKVVTPLRPTGWTLLFDGKSVSLHPSIGNWCFPCRSHYWIRRNRVLWAAPWSQHEIDAARVVRLAEGSCSLAAVATEATRAENSPQLRKPGLIYTARRILNGLRRPKL